MTNIIESKEQQVCNECDRHCPMDDLRCGRGRRAAGLDVADGRGDHGDHGDYGNHGDHGAHGDRGGRENRRNGENRREERGFGRERSERGKHGEHGPGRERGERGCHSHKFNTNAEGTEGLYARLRQCGHYLFHNGKDYSSQKKILMILSENDGEMTQRELTDELGIHRASVSEVLGKLEKKELIARSQDEQDRRRVQITLTKKGEKAVREGKNTQEGQDAETLFAVLSEEEKECLRTILGKLIQEWNRGDKCRKKE